MKITDFQQKKQQKEKISLLTCYDYPSARIIADSSIDAILVGDSVAMVVHGHDNTTKATMDMMVMHTEAVARGLGKQLLISDLPFLSHRVSRADTVHNVKRLLHAGASTIKIEGSDDDTCETIAFLVAAGIPIIGHIGLTPQWIYQWGAFKVQGKNDEDALHVLQQAKRLEQAGCTALVIECVPQQLAQRITETVSIATIGIGAGNATDGQILVWHDLLGLQNEFKPRFLKQYAQSRELMLSAINAYAAQVKTLQFPSEEHAFN